MIEVSSFQNTEVSVVTGIRLSLAFYCLCSSSGMAMLIKTKTGSIFY